MKNIIFISILVASILGVNYWLEFEKEHNVKEYLKNKTSQIYLEYEVIYNNYKTLSSFVYKNQVNKPHILKAFKSRDRKALYELLKDDYKELKKYNIRQLHFHLPNNVSFLRMHRPNKHGDDLTNFRSTVKYTNENIAFIDGFEEGRIYNGFRFVYPLVDGKEHLGSVEVSFSSNFFIHEIMRSYSVSANFLIKKEIVEQKVRKDELSNYIQSPYKEYLYQKSVYENVKVYHEDKVSEEEMEFVTKHLDDKKPYSLFVEEKNQVSTFIPLVNPITKKSVALLKVDSKNYDILNKNKHKKNVLIIISVLLSLIMFFIYKLFKFKDNLEHKVEEKTQELNDLNKNLEIIIEKEIAKNKEKDELMIVQSRHAAMGEMISMIAHQWRQPIAVISMGANNILVDIELDMVTNEDLEDLAKDILEQTSYLSKTIDDFRNFFKPEKTKDKFMLNDILDESLKIVGKSLENNNIELVVNLNSSVTIESYSRELLQVLINILKNAKEALEEHKESNREITINTYDEEDYANIEIIDNAGGVDKKIQDKIFDPYFSTKAEKQGTGLGLYMSKTIIEKHLYGKISLNSQSGITIFKISIPLEMKEENNV